MKWIRDEHGVLVNLEHICAISIGGGAESAKVTAWQPGEDGSWTLFRGTQHDCEQWFSVLSQHIGLLADVAIGPGN